MTAKKDTGETPEGDEEGGTQYDAPNQQVVRADGSAPWEEGNGGTDVPEPQSEPEPEPKDKPADEDVREGR